MKKQRCRNYYWETRIAMLVVAMLMRVHIFFKLSNTNYCNGGEEKKKKKEISKTSKKWTKLIEIPLAARFLALKYTSFAIDSISVLVTSKRISVRYLRTFTCCKNDIQSHK